MKKKPNLIKNLKEKIRDLQESVRYRDVEIGRLGGKLEKYEEKEKELISSRFFAREMEVGEIERLNEIIRWLIKPSTAEKKLTPKQEELLRRGF